MEIIGLKCLRCGHEWLPKYPKPPGVCPLCKSSDWNKPRKMITGGERKIFGKPGRMRSLVMKKLAPECYKAFQVVQDEAATETQLKESCKVIAKALRHPDITGEFLYDRLRRRL